MIERVLVVIPCLNEENFLAGPLTMLLQAAQRLPMRIVIADGGSTDATLRMAQAYVKNNSNVFVINNPKMRQGPAINDAVRSHGQGCEYLIRIDAHCEYPNDFCDVLVKEADQTGAASVVVAMSTVGKTWFQKAAAAAQNSKLGNGGSAHRLSGGEGKWIDHGHHALMRIDAFNAVKGYDESFSHNEDAELDTRLIANRFKIWLTAKTFVTYYPRSSAGLLFQQYYNYGAGRARNLMKHRSKPKLRQLAPAAVLPIAVLSLIGPLLPIATFPFWCWIVLCLTYGAILAIKAKQLEIVMSGPLAMIMHMAWSIGFWISVSKIFREERE